LLTIFGKIFIVMLFKTIIGPYADGDLYFSRPYLDDRLWKHIQNGSHILISAPRRIGKTSFLQNICDKGKDGYLVKYHNTESINSSNEFFKRLYKSLLEELSTKEHIWENITEIRKRNRIEKIGAEGIELKGIDLDYFEEFRRLINKIDFDKHLLFIVDEFSETTENIINDQGENAGRLFLHQNREIRQDKSISRKIQFIYCGSIGLGNIAERLNVIKSINDFPDFSIPSFSEEEAFALINQITVGPKLVFEQKVRQYLLDRINWLMPYYIQIILDEVETILLQSGKQPEVTEEVIDHAIDEALKKRNYFEHWHTRLRTALKGKHYTFAKEVLNAVSKSKSGFSKTQIFDLAEKYELREQYNIILRTLEYDGYISPSEKQIFVFNSPLLKIWWERNIAI